MEVLTKENLSYEVKATLFILAIFFVRLITLYTTGIELHLDESYYFLWSKNLAWSYYDHPPMIAYLIALSNLVISNIELAVKIVPNFLFCGTSIYIFLLGKELFDKKAAFYAMVLINILPFYLGESVYASPDAPMVFFLSGASYYFYIATKRGKAKLWILAAIFTGLSLLSKYIAVLIFPSFFFYLLLPENRNCFKRKIVYISFVLSCLLFLPVILWNYSNGWMSIKFQLDHGFGGDTFPNWLTFGEFLGGQVLLIGPILFILFMIIAIYMILKWKKCLIGEKYLWFLSIIPFFFFFLCSLQERVEGNWPVYVYIPGTLLIVLVYERIFRHKKSFKNLWIINWIYCWLIAAAIMIIINTSFLPINIGKFGEFFGWKQLGKEINQIVKQNPNSILAARHYSLASEIEVYSGDKVGCVVYGAKQFRIWGKPTFFSSPNTYIYCTNHERKTKERDNCSDELIKVIPIKYANKIIRKIYVYKIVYSKGRGLP